jgi:hypothetical protein
MPDYKFNQAEAQKQMSAFFKNERATINSFGNTVNQTFEAHVFAHVIKWYRKNGWNVSIVNPIKNGRQIFQLKFSTRGAPIGYSYAICRKNNLECQIRHGLRVATKFYKKSYPIRANVVCDIVIMNNIDIDHLKTDDHITNESLISFGEVKHMSAFAELIANFIGLVHELQPQRLKKIRIKKWQPNGHVSSFLYVSGILYTTAKGINETIIKRKYDLDIYSHETPLT